MDSVQYSITIHSLTQQKLNCVDVYISLSHGLCIAMNSAVFWFSAHILAHDSKLMDMVYSLGMLNACADTFHWQLCQAF